MPHDELVELTDKFFSSLKSLTVQPSQSRLACNTSSTQLQPHLLSPSSPSIAKSLTRAASYLFPNPVSPTIPGTAAIPKSPTSTYTGGHQFILDTNEQLNHLYIAFEGLGIDDDDVYALAVMQVLLGGGGSFSASEDNSGGGTRGNELRPEGLVDERVNGLHCAARTHDFCEAPPSLPSY